MADGRQRRRAPRRTLIRPLIMLASGALAGVVLWRVLMLEPAPATRVAPSATEQLSRQDRNALDGVLKDRSSRP